MPSKILKHDHYVDTLCERIHADYELLLRNVPLYSNRRRLIGEIDVLAYKEGYCDIYEVKCSHRISKARRQVSKFMKILSQGSKVRSGFFFCGESGALMPLQ